MNRAALRDTCRDAHAVLDRLLKILEAIDEERDDWVVFLYRARKEYDRAAVRAGKSGKQLVATAERAFFQAGQRGFKGTYRDWIALMRVPFKYDPDTPEEKLRRKVMEDSHGLEERRSLRNPLPP